MTRFASAICLIVVLFSGFWPENLSAKNRDLPTLPTLNIVADPSLMVPLTRIVRNYTVQHNQPIITSFSASRELTAHIASGMEADLFISNRTKYLNDLKARGLVDVYSQTPITRNRLVVATAKDNPIELILIRNLPIANILLEQHPNFSFALGDPEFLSVGSYSLEALRNFGLDGDLEPYFILLQSQSDLLHAITSEHNYGILFQSDVVMNDHIRKLDVFPENTHKPISYQAVVVAGERMEEARKFIQYLTSNEAQAVFKKLGFEAP